VRLTASIDGMNRVLRKLGTTEGGAIYAEPWTRALRSLVDEAQRDVRATAPQDTGRLDAKTVGKLQASPIPKWGVVTTNATNRGYRYPWALEASNRYHYRSGSRRGQTTKGYFARVRDELQGKVNRVLADAARDIESKFNSR